MTTSESARHDLYNGLTESLGPQRAETLMTALLAYDTSDLVTKSDLTLFGAELRAEFKSDLAGVKARIDRLFLAMMSGFLVTLGTSVGFFLSL